MMSLRCRQTFDEVQFETSYTLINSEDSWLNYCLIQKRFAFDLETTSLDPQDAQIIACCLLPKNSFVIDCRVKRFDLFIYRNQTLHPLLKPLIFCLKSHGSKNFHNAKI